MEGESGAYVSKAYGGLYLLSSCLSALEIQAHAACGTLYPSGTREVGEQ